MGFNSKGCVAILVGFADTLLSFLLLRLTVVSSNQWLLALMTILAQSLLTLVSSHFVALLLFSVWHNTKMFIVKNLINSSSSQ